MDLERRYTAARKKALQRYFGGLNEMQRQAVFQMEGPLLILAGAGSGKTTVLISRMENMIRFGNAYHDESPPAGAGGAELELLEAYAGGKELPVDRLCALAAARPVKPWNILAITFTNKAAGELRQRLAVKLGEEVTADIQASTFHSLCVRILRREIEALGYNRSFTIYDADDSLRVIKEAMKAARIDEKILTAKAVRGAISRAKDQLDTPQGMQSRAGDDYKTACVAKVWQAYQHSLKEASALDFDDLILKVVELFTQFPEALAHYQGRYRYIMVDEYQDTNHAQYRLISLLAGKHHNLCVVGDDDQSIYKFRGATIENILSFEEQFPQTVTIRLEQNYRSTGNILSAANQLIANNLQRKGKNLWTNSGEGEPIRVYRVRDELEESRLIADAILEGVKNGARFSDHAVLYRMNAQSNSVEKALAKNAIPYRIIGGLRFYERKEIKDVVAYLSVLVNPGDSLRLSRIINEPKRGIGGSTVTAAQGIADVEGLSLFEVISKAGEYPLLAKKSAVLGDFGGMMDALRQMAEEEPLDRLLDKLLEDTGYLRALELQGFEGQGRIENIMELKSNILRYVQENETPTLAGFLEEIALYTDLDNYDAEADAAVLMTVHSAKGLEFPHVFLVGMDEGVFPGRTAMLYPAEIEEERRLCYVALTRAKERLTVTSTERRLIFGQTTFNRPSRFLGELPREHTDYQDKTVMARKQAREPAKPARSKFTPSSMSIGVGAAAGQPKGPVQSIKAGDSVRHSVFGQGQVLSVKPMGGDTLVEIQFDKKFGVKKVMANFARLTKL